MNVTKNVVALMEDYHEKMQLVSDEVYMLLWWHDQNPDIVADILATMKDYDFPLRKIQEWVENNATSDIIDDIVEYHPMRWAIIGINPDSYIKAWVDIHGWEYIYGYSLAILPKTIPVKVFLEHIPVREIFELLPEIEEFEDFLDDYLSCGGRLEDLIKKTLDEVGYTAEYADHVMSLYLAESTKVSLRRRVLNPLRVRTITETKKLNSRFSVVG